jgi:hypothetical protein
MESFVVTEALFLTIRIKEWRSEKSDILRFNVPIHQLKLDTLWKYMWHNDLVSVPRYGEILVTIWQSRKDKGRTALFRYEKHICDTELGPLASQRIEVGVKDMLQISLFVDMTFGLREPSSCSFPAISRIELSFTRKFFLQLLAFDSTENARQDALATGRDIEIPLEVLTEHIMDRFGEKYRGEFASLPAIRFDGTATFVDNFTSKFNQMWLDGSRFHVKFSTPQTRKSLMRIRLHLVAMYSIHPVFEGEQSDIFWEAVIHPDYENSSFSECWKAFELIKCVEELRPDGLSNSHISFFPLGRLDCLTADAT